MMYNKIIKSILKAIYESIFDDMEDLDDLILGEGPEALMSMKFEQHIMNTLCVNDSYHPVLHDEADGFPYIKQDPNNPTLYYIAPYGTYKTYKFGPRKRKQYTLNYFYRYILKFNDNGYIDLSVTKFNTRPNMVINQQIYNFIAGSNIKILNLYFIKPGNDYIIHDSKFSGAYIIDSSAKKADKKFTDIFVYNFPDNIFPKSSASEKNTPNPYGDDKTHIERRWFTNDNQYIKLTDKLVNNGFAVVDENEVIYNSSNIEEKHAELLSGESDNQAEINYNNKINFLKELLGEKHYDKFLLILQYYKSHNNDIIYLKTLNTFRTCKLTLHDTVYNLLKENNMQITEFDENVIPGGYSKNFHYLLLYKMFYIMNTEKLNDWRITYDYKDCTDGTEGYYGFMYLDLNNLPIKITDVLGLYKLYYVIGKALLQCKGLYEYAVEKTGQKADPGVYNPMFDLSAYDVQLFNKDLRISISDLDFTYLNNQLKTIIDKTCKKLKIK